MLKKTHIDIFQIHRIYIPYFSHLFLFPLFFNIQYFEGIKRRVDSIAEMNSLIGIIQVFWKFYLLRVNAQKIVSCFLLLFLAIFLWILCFFRRFFNETDCSFKKYSIKFSFQKRSFDFFENLPWKIHQKEKALLRKTSWSNNQLLAILLPDKSISSVPVKELERNLYEPYPWLNILLGNSEIKESNLSPNNLIKFEEVDKRMLIPLGMSSPENVESFIILIVKLVFVKYLIELVQSVVSNSYVAGLY